MDGGDSRSEPISCLRETAAGCFYAQILDALFPGKVRMNGIVWGKHGGVLEHEVTNNFKASKKIVWFETNSFVCHSYTTPIFPDIVRKIFYYYCGGT